MEVKIYIKVYPKKNEQGVVLYLLEYMDKKGSVHKRGNVEQAKGTRNRLCLYACISALKKLIRPCDVKVYIDNDHIKAVQEKWIQKWKDSSWKKANNKEVANIKEWKQLDMLMQIHNISFWPYSDKYEKELEELKCGKVKILE